MKIRNMANMGLLALRANIMGAVFPLNVMLSVTNRCNGKCVYCRIPTRGGSELSLMEIKSLIDQVRELGCQRLGIWGGEPLLRDDIGEIISYAKDKALFVTLDSNGYLLHKRREIFKKLDHLILAFDGEEKAHDANRGAGSFQKVMEAVESARGKIPLWTITVLTRNNMHCVDFVLKTAKEYGFLTTFQLLHHNDILGADYNALLPREQDCKDVIREILRQKQGGAPVASSVSYLEHLLHWPDLSISSSCAPLKRARCWAGKLYCNVDTDGAVYPCSLLIGKSKSVNFLNVGFKSAFAGLSNGVCRSCLASCYTEYNYLYSLDIKTIMGWTRAMAISA